jgi:hypothetical protein
MAPQKQLSNEVFVDNAALVAQINKRDNLHIQAVSLNQRLVLKEKKLITHMYIIDETVAELTGRVPHPNIVGFIEDIFSSQIFDVLHVTEKHEKTAWNLYKERQDKLWSLTDCVSFVIMKERGITDAFTSDHHFVQAGFTKLL